MRYQAALRTDLNLFLQLIPQILKFQSHILEDGCKYFTGKPGLPLPFLCFYSLSSAVYGQLLGVQQFLYLGHLLYIFLRIEPLT